MPKKENMSIAEHCHGHKRGKGAMMIILGALVLANAYGKYCSWSAFIGWLLVLAGIIKLLMKE